MGDQFWPSSLLYLREELLKSYLVETAHSSVWGLWGERNLRWSQDERPFPESIQEALRADENNFGSWVVWSG